MDWDPYIDSVDYAAPPPPISFFHHTLEAQLFRDDGYSATGCTPSSAMAATLTGDGPPVNSSASSCDESDFSDLIGDTFSENLLNNEPLSILSAEEIFSQIDYVCGTELQQSSSGQSSPRDESQFCLVKEEFCYSAASSRVQSPVNDPLAIATAAAFLTDDSSFSVNSISDTSSCTGDFLTDQSLDKVELDIAKLKQEVDSTSDEDSLWSDFFSEEDSSEISPEYENLLKSLLSTPVDDIDLSLNVFNNVEEEESEQQSDELNQAVVLDNILFDHCYTLPWSTEEMEEDRDGVQVSTLTPPNSGDDSEYESDLMLSSPSSVEPCELVPKFMNPKTVKLKHKKDLKFVFSFKVKEETDSDVKDFSSSFVTNNKTQSIKSTPQLCKKSIYKGVSVLKRNIGSHHHSSLQRNQTFSNQHTASIKRTSSGNFTQPAARGDFEEDGEAAMAVQTIMIPESIRGLTVNRAMKMQTDREIHNSMERQRRIQLKKEFDTLKDRIPDIRGNDKVSKLNVLNVAAGYVKKLEKVEAKLRQRKHNLREEKRRLIQQLAMLNQT